MKKRKRKMITRAELAAMATCVLHEKIIASAENTERLSALLERFESDPDLTATEKKQLVSKINAAFLLTTDELIKISTTFSDKDAKENTAEQVRVVLSDEVQKWAV